jgi:transcription-repair coupling factor (superfamily II helicase)
LTFAFAQDTPVAPEKIIALLEQDAQKYSFSPDFRLGVRLGRQPGEEALGEAKKALQGLL